MTAKSDASFHRLEIKNRTIYLDGLQIKGVSRYELNDDVINGAQLTLHILLGDVVIEKEAAHEERPKVISPMKSLHTVLDGLPEAVRPGETVSVESLSCLGDVSKVCSEQ